MEMKKQTETVREPLAGCLFASPTLLSGMRTNTNCYVSCTGFSKGCYGLFRAYYGPLEWVETLSTRCIPWLEETLYPCTQLRAEEVPGSAGDGQAVADRYKRCGVFLQA